MQEHRERTLFRGRRAVNIRGKRDSIPHWNHDLAGAGGSPVCALPIAGSMHAEIKIHLRIDISDEILAWRYGCVKDVGAVIGSMIRDAAAGR